MCSACFIPHLKAQDKNLVKNPSFETYEKCPEGTTDLVYKLIPFWTIPTAASSDYFNRCGAKDVKVPSNFAGISEPKSGDAYVGAILTGSEYNYREYFQGTLTRPLEKGKKYCVSFYYRLASYSRYAVDQLSIYFSQTEIKTAIRENLSYNPQLNNKPGLFLDNLEDWERYCQVFTSNGNENFFVIGNFKNYDHTNYVVTDKNVTNLRNKSYAYYFFDDFSIKELENCNDCPCVPHSMAVALIDSSYTGGFDPRTGIFKGLKDDGKITLAIRGGTPPYQVSWSSNKLTGPRLTNLPAGVYTYKAFDQFNCNSSGTIIFKAPEIPADAISDGLKNIEEGSAIVLKNIFFEYNKTALLPTSFTELDKVVAFMKESGVQLIEISGHTDSDGSDKYNTTLSQGRAKSVVDYLISQGIEPTRLRAVGYGKTRPIETNQSPDGKGVNRRVEFLLVKK